MHPLQRKGGGGLKISEKIFAGGGGDSEILILVVGGRGRGHVILN